MLRIKPGVLISVIDPNMLVAWMAVTSVCASMGLDAHITSHEDGSHKAGSLHYVGRATDFRTHHISRDQLQTFVKEVTETLPDGFDAVLENVNEPTEHLHIEWDPKEV